MPLYFLAFLATLLLSILLFVAAAAYVAVMRKPVPMIIKGGTANRLQAAGLALLWAGAGMGWLLFFNVYRIHVDMNALGNEALQAFSRGYTTRLPIVVLPYGCACLVSAVNLWGAPGRLSRRALWVVAALCSLSILTTPFAAGAQGEMQEHGFSDAAYEKLQLAHFARTMAFTIAALWMLVEGWTRPATGMTRAA